MNSELFSITFVISDSFHFVNNLLFTILNTGQVLRLQPGSDKGVFL